MSAQGKIAWRDGIAAMLRTRAPHGSAPGSSSLRLNAISEIYGDGNPVLSSAVTTSTISAHWLRIFKKKKRGELLMGAMSSTLPQNFLHNGYLGLGIICN